MQRWAWLLVAVATGILSSPAVAQTVEGGTPTAHELEVARLEREIALLELRQQQAEAENAIRQARVDAVTASGFTGAVEAGAGAGEPEAAVLAAAQAMEAARQIVSELPARANGSTGPDIFVIGGAVMPDLSEARRFNARQMALLDGLQQARAGFLASELGLAHEETLTAPVRFGMSAVADALSMVQVAHAALSYLASDYTIEGVTVAGVDNNLLVSALLGAGGGRIASIAQGGGTPGGFAEFTGMLESLDRARQDMEPIRQLCVWLSVNDLQLQSELCLRRSVRRKGLGMPSASRPAM